MAVAQRPRTHPSTVQVHTPGPCGQRHHPGRAQVQAWTRTTSSQSCRIHLSWPGTRLFNQPWNQALRPGPGTRPGTRNFLVKVFVFLLHSPLVITIPARNLWRVWEAGKEPSESSVNRSLTRWKIDSAKTCGNISGLAESSGSPVLRPGGSNSHS